MSPLKNSTSVPHSPTRATSMTTSPVPGRGGSTSSTAARPGPETTTARTDLLGTGADIDDAGRAMMSRG